MRGTKKKGGNVQNCFQVDVILTSLREMETDALPRGLALWALRVGDWRPCEEEWQRCLAAVGKGAEADAERARIARFRKPVRDENGALVWVEGRANPDARSALVGRLLLLAMARHNRLSKEVLVRRTPHGRPYYDVDRGGAEAPLLFDANISHHGDWVVAACDTTAVVGVDVLKRECRGTATVSEYVASMSKATMTPAEVAQLHCWASRQQQQHTECREHALLDAFCTTWTLKEAFVKALGDGLSFDLQRASFVFSSDEAPLPPEAPAVFTKPARAWVSVDGVPQPPSTFALSVYALDSQHTVALCRAAPSAVSDELRRALGCSSFSSHVPQPDARPCVGVVASVKELLARE